MECLSGTGIISCTKESSVHYSPGRKACEQGCQPHNALAGASSFLESRDQTQRATSVVGKCRQPLTMLPALATHCPELTS